MIALLDEKIISGDFIAKSSAWGSPIGDSRGNLLLDFISSLNPNDHKIGFYTHFLVCLWHFVYRHQP